MLGVAIHQVPGNVVNLAVAGAADVGLQEVEDLARGSWLVVVIDEVDELGAPSVVRCRQL